MRDFSDPAVFDSYLGELETWYVPAWSVYTATASVLLRLRCRNVFDFGCGTGRLVPALSERATPGPEYFGLDDDGARVSFVLSRYGAMPTVTATSNAEEFVRWAQDKCDIGFVSTFCLHDQIALDEILDHIRGIAPKHIVVWDLTRFDLPRLTAKLTCAFNDRRAREPRGKIEELASRLEQSGRAVVTTHKMHKIEFPSLEKVLDYVVAFGLHEGADLGLDTGDRADALSKIQFAMGKETFPFLDDRHFMSIEAIADEC